jgi:hypothetical protein
MRTRTLAFALVAAASFTAACSPEEAAAPEEETSEAALGSCAAARSGDHYEFLDDVCHKKVLPTDVDRNWQCPNVATSATATPAGGGAAVTYAPASAAVSVDAAALRGIVPDSLEVTLVLVRRVGGRPHYRYLSNGTHDHVAQPWSATKFMAVANGARALREASGGRAGLDATVQGVPLGDLVTTIHNYDERRFSSNGLARWFHDVGGRSEANDLVHDWLRRPASETFGGNYGAPAPGLGYTFRAPSGASFSVDPDGSTGPRNALSTRTMAEFLKRLVMHREDAETRLPGIQWVDLQHLFYGAPTSTMFPGKVGGMSADTAIYVQSAVDVAKVQSESRGKFRVFSKLGFGDGHYVENQYACFPVLDATGKPVPDAGKEMFLSVRLESGGASERERDALLARHVKAIVTRVMDGRLR